MGVGGIPYSEITDYLNEHRIPCLEEREQYRRWIGLLDGIYVEKAGKKEK